MSPSWPSGVDVVIPRNNDLTNARLTEDASNARTEGFNRIK